MSPDLLRDSTFGFLVNYASGGRLFPYADQRPDYVVPQRYLQQPPNVESPFPRTLSSAPTLVSSSPAVPSGDNSTLVGADGVCDKIKSGDDVEKQLGETPSPAPSSGEPPYRWLVEFEENDPDRPQYVLSSLLLLL
jgi:DHA1 family multidrug resistance protein-like MFS transporter